MSAMCLLSADCLLFTKLADDAIQSCSVLNIRNLDDVGFLLIFAKHADIPCRRRSIGTFPSSSSPDSLDVPFIFLFHQNR